MTYILDLQQLWNDRTQMTPSATIAARSLALDPRQHVVSVILVANFSEEEKLLQELQSIISQWFIREIIVICPEDFKFEKSLEKFSKLHPRCYKVTVKKSTGLAQAYNFGAQYASGQFLLFMDSSVNLEKNTVFKLLATGIRKPSPWVVGFKSSSNNRLNSIMSKLTNFYSSPYSGNINNPKMLPEVSLPGGGLHALSVANSGFLMPTKTFIELKGMDQKCLHNTFHLDFCLRIHLAGGGVYEAQDVTAIERKSPHSIRSLYEIISQEWEIFRATCYFYQKYVRKKTNFIWVGMRYACIAFQALGWCAYRSARYFFNDPKPIMLP